jgi:long-chain acyl-CoA synthetase
VPIFPEIRRVAERYPDHPAVRFQGRDTTYRELLGMALRVRAALEEAGIGRGDFVSLILPNHVAYVASFLGTVSLGATVVPVNPIYKAPEIAYILGDARAKAVITAAPLLAKVLEAKAQVPSLAHVFSLGGGEGTIPLEAVLVEGRLSTTESRVEDDDVATCLYTSGTTGRPKGALLTHDNLLFDAQACRTLLDVGPDERYLTALPLFHSFAQMVCLLLPLLTGGTTVLLERLMPETLLETLARERITIFPAVPALYGAILATAEREGVERYDLSQLKLCVSGGAALPVALMERFESLFGTKILEGNGPTECGPVSYCNPVEGVRKPGTVGLPLPGIEVKIAGPDDEELPRGAIGEILVRGRNVMKGYLNRPEETKEALRGGWFHTGDLGFMDEDGYITIVDRLKDMIIVGGFNVYPREIEEVLYAHPAVQDAAVIGVPDELRGEVPKAFVTLRPGQQVTSAELLRYLRERLANYKVPKTIEFRDNLPKTETGKVLKKALREGL